MSLYREPGRVRRRRRLIVGGAVLGLAVAVLAVVLLAGRDDGPPSRADRAAGAREAASAVHNALELVEIEYREAVRGGRVIAPTEYRAALADVDRAEKALADHARDIAVAAPGQGPRALAALRGVATVVESRADAAALRRAAAGARAAVQPLAEAR